MKISDAVEKLNRIMTTPVNKGFSLNDADLEQLIKEEDKNIADLEIYDRFESENRKIKSKSFVDRVRQTDTN